MTAPVELELPARVHGTLLVRPAARPADRGTDGAAGHRSDTARRLSRLAARPADRGTDGAALVVGFHGYGETAERHLAELERLPGAEGWALCAVQGLNLFYTRTGDVVASWMTRHRRERAIADNLAWVAAAVERAQRETAAGERLAFAGFSQGVAMAYRAAADCLRRGVPCHALVALAGDVPPELAERDLAGFPPVLIGRGSREEWYSAAKLAADRELLAGKGIATRLVEFEGGHEWTDAFRRAAGDFLRDALAT